MLVAELQGGGGRIEVHHGTAEAELDRWQLGRGLDQHAVQPLAADRMDDFTLMLAVGQQRAVAGQVVQLPAAHRDQFRPHALEHAGVLERPEPARGERQVDGAAALGRAAARIGAALEHLHTPAAPRQQDGEQRAHGPGADDGDPRPRRRQARPSAAANCSAARQASA